MSTITSKQPSLVNQSSTASAPPLGADSITPKFKSAPMKPKTLFDLMYEGFYALFILKNGSAPQELEPFTKSIMSFLKYFEHKAKKLNASPDDIYDAKYAYCAAVDEIVLRSNSPIRSAWERKPLQLALFGDQLAGENFFVVLEKLRAEGKPRVEALEVFHMCLLLGFQGKYMLDTPEKLNYLTARLGDEIAMHRGKTKGFAPFWARPDDLVHKLRNEVPLWVIGCLFLFIAAISYTLFSKLLTDQTQSAMLPYNEVIQMAPRTANITITLP